MAQHYRIRPDQREVALAVASRALRVANGLATARPGNVYIPNRDQNGEYDGTGTWIGSGEVGNGGVAQWIGDTTPPGRPTGCSCSSAWGTVYCRWDGTLDGGVPADFAYVSVSVSGAEMGRMAEAGVLALDGYEDGTELDVSFVAYDAARDRTGALAPNASEATVVHVTAVDARAEIDVEVSQAREDAEAALEQAQQTATDAAAGVAEAKDAAQAAKDAADEAKATADGYQQQITEVTTKVGGIETDVSELSAEVSGAVEDAAGALSAASKAQQDIDGFKQTVSQTYQPKGDYATSTDLQSYATKSEVEQTAGELSASVAAVTETAEGALSQASQAKQTADSVKTSLETNYVSKTDASQTYASKSELSATSSSLSASIEEVAETADAAQKKALDVEATADGLSTTISQVSTVANQAKSAADTASTAAGKAQSTADSAVKQVTSLSATVDGIETSVATAQETAESAVEAASAAQQSVDGFKTTVSQTYATKTSVSAVEDKADAAQSAANSAASAASTAQSTANTAKSNAATAQTTANTAKANAATAQDAADAAQADLDAYKGTVSSTYATKSSVEQTADSITQEVAATYQPKGDYATNAGVAATYATKTALSQTEDSITAEVAKTYQTKDGMSSYASKSYVDQQDSSIKSTVSSVKSTADNALSKASSVEQTAEGLEVKLTSTTTTANSALSKANSAATAASNAQTTANAAKKQVWYSAVGTSGTAGYIGIATIKITSAYANVPLYFEFTSRSMKATPVWIRFASVNGVDPTLSSITADGDANVYIRKTATSTWQVIVQKSEAYDQVSVTDFNNGGHYMNDKVTVTWTNTMLTSLPSGCTKATVLAGKRNSSDIDNAAKTATNYLKFDSAGLCVGNQTAASLGYNVLVKSTGFDVRNGSTVLSSFGASAAELARNSRTAQVKMCGGACSVQGSTASGSGVVTILANKLSSDSNSPEIVLEADGAYDAAVRCCAEDNQHSYNSGVRGTILLMGSAVRASNGSKEVLLSECWYPLSLGGVTAHDSSSPPRWRIRGGWCQLEGRVKAPSKDLLVADLGWLVDDSAKPGSGANRNFCCYGNNTGGAGVAMNVYMNSSGKLYCSQACQFVDLSGVRFAAKAVI